VCRYCSRFVGEVDVVRLLCPFEALLLSAEPVLFVLAGFAARGFHTAHRPALVSCLVMGYILLVLWGHNCPVCGYAKLAEPPYDKTGCVSLC
jgi:hypothetical protein